MAIKLKAQRPRTELRPEFWDAVDFYVKKMGLSVVEAIRGARNARHAAQLAKAYASILANLKKAKERDVRLETVLLRSNWDIITANAFRELVFVKKNLVMRPIRYADRFLTLDAGEYHCVIKHEAFSLTSPRPDQIRFRPVVPDTFTEWHKRQPDNQYNHPHQKPHSTCWGNYNAWIIQSLKTFNIADIQDAMWKFVSHYTPRDTLARPPENLSEVGYGNFPWYKIHIPTED